MNANELCSGMIVDFKNQAVEVLAVDADTGLAAVRNCSSYERTQAQCEQLSLDPQLHTDSFNYY
ncbi:hypothetical protein GCM10011369_10640 [Neiella marina]|uniref:Uncharacterized protein n=1 Tax=Neiella marina TaxID=508461 RepID=A0A8J2U3Q0_9GAMM|nr:hypothetical protein [Neiella marina]GGA70771.1 hypothetical protein GCM10011369_10640 [Neiella marina]